jgi:hypothetical protein
LFTGEEGLKEIAITASESGFEGCLPSQAVDLKNLLDAGGIPDWVVVTPLGLACWQCRKADMESISVHGAVQNSWRSQACTSKRPGEAIWKHEHSVSKKELQKITRNGEKEPETAHQQRVVELDSRRKQARALLKGHQTMLTAAEEAIHARLDATLFLAENKMPMSQLKAQLEFVSRRGGLSRCPQDGANGAFDSLTASYTSAEIADQLVYAVAAAITLRYKPLLEQQDAIGLASDGTGRAKRSHQAMLCVDVPTCFLSIFWVVVALPILFCPHVYSNVLVQLHQYSTSAALLHHCYSTCT